MPEFESERSGEIKPTQGARKLSLLHHIGENQGTRNQSALEPEPIRPRIPIRIASPGRIIARNKFRYSRHNAEVDDN